MAILPNSIYSPDHLRFCINELKDYAGLLEQRTRGSAIPLPELSIESTDLLTEIKGADSSRPDVVTALALELQRHLEAAPHVTVTLPAPPPHGLKIELVRWFRANTRPEVMLEFLVNPDIAGGMVVRANSKVFDFSFRSQLLSNSANFVKTLERV
jgi:hypothetical protein